MLYDIAQLQRQYGANSNYNAENNTSYVFTNTIHPFTTQGITARPDQVLMTLWDAGGINDVVNASGVTTNVKVDLREGEFSAIGTEYVGGKDQYNVGIAFGAVIENAIGGSGADTLIGNSSNNELNGGAGNDLLQGREGIDTYLFTNSFGTDTIKDSDGLGLLKISGQLLDGGKTISRDRWLGKTASGAIVSYQLLDSSTSSTGKRLLVSLDGTNSVSIDDFDLAKAQSASGYLGIKLQSAPKIVIQPGSATTPFSALNFDFDPGTYPASPPTSPKPPLKPSPSI